VSHNKNGIRRGQTIESEVMWGSASLTSRPKALDLNINQLARRFRRKRP